VIRTRDDLRLYLDADLASYELPSWRFSYRVTHRQAYWHWLLRHAEYHINVAKSPVARLESLIYFWRFMRMSERVGYTIPVNVFGPGLSIAHKGTVVVNGSARVGKNCRLHPDCTIGQHEGRNATIGDNVWIAPGARVVGGVSIGDRAAIGANAVVVRDVPAGVTVGGIPARQISDRGSTPAMVIEGYQIARNAWPLRR
jgi:serine O-acetyltransferase